MRIQVYFFYGQYVLFWNIINYDFANTKPLMGHGVRQVIPGEFPFIVGITHRTQVVDPERDTLCTGSIITKHHVLSATHCLRDLRFNGIQVIVGSIYLTSDSKYYPAWWITYDQWNEIKNIQNEFKKNDIIMMRLTENVHNDIPFGILSYLPQLTLSDKRVIAAGWGEINNGSYPRILQTVDLKILSKNNCENKITRVHGGHLHVDVNILCTERDPFAILMSGDSGGPILYMNNIIAINMGTCPFPQQRFHPDKVNLHTNIFYYQRYLNEIINDF